MHAQLRISTTAKRTKSTKLARPVEADSETLTHSRLPVSGLLVALVRVRHPLLRWRPTHVLGSQAIKMHRGGRYRTG